MELPRLNDIIFAPWFTQLSTAFTTDDSDPNPLELKAFAMTNSKLPFWLFGIMPLTPLLLPNAAITPATCVPWPCPILKFVIISC